jgi:hypothetical protein
MLERNRDNHDTSLQLALSSTFKKQVTKCQHHHFSRKASTIMSDNDLGFRFRRSKSGDARISHNGKSATTLRGDRAARFLEDMSALGFDDQQQEMARLTGNYRRGNERLAKLHPRNQSVS